MLFNQRRRRGPLLTGVIWSRPISDDERARIAAGGSPFPEPESRRPRRLARVGLIVVLALLAAYLITHL